MKKKLYIFIIFVILFTINFSKIYCIETPNAIVISKDTGRVLYEKNGYKQVKMASLTKVMTSLLLVENCNMDEEINVNPKATTIGGSKAGLLPNDIVTARSLLYGMLLPSGNDCALATAYHIGGDIENFANMMNLKAIELGLKNTHFTNPHGLDNDEHYSTAYDLAILTKFALEYPEIQKAMSTKTIDLQLGSKSVTLNNTNRLLKTYAKATGGKTGFTNGANRCLISTAKDNNMDLICVLLGSPTTDIRFNESKELLENIFNNYNVYDLDNYLNIYIKIPIIKGKDEYFEYVYKDIKKEVLTEDEYSRIHIKTDFPQTLTPPLKNNTYIGNYSLLIDDEILYSKDIYLNYDILSKTPADYFIQMLKKI